MSKTSAPSDLSKAISQACYERVRKLVYARSRIDLGDRKKELVQSRLSKRLRVLQIDTYDAYMDFVESPSGKEEVEQLINSMSTNHTFFFREPQHFELLKNTVLPALHKQPANKPIRIWSAASSSGEEAYTLAIVLAEFFRTHGDRPWRIECTDISSTILDKARQGIYPDERLGKVPLDVKRRYFQKGLRQWDGYFRVKRALREHVHFQYQNLLEPPYPFDEKFDVIFCRNVMIYFNPKTQEELVGYMDKLLKPGGYLMIGHSESLNSLKHPYKTVQPAAYHKPE